jgi:hypothetical protein
MFTYSRSTPCRHFVSLRHKIAGKGFESRVNSLPDCLLPGALTKIAQAMPELIFKKCAELEVVRHFCLI